MNPLDRAPHLLALRPMLRCAFIGFALFVTLGCSSDVLTTKVPCLTDSDCGSSQSCFQDACTDDFSIISGLPCDQSRQCEGGNTCFEFFCTPGCTDVYYTSDCPQDYFCKPTSHAYATNESGERSLLGECAASECTSDGDCGTNETCVELALNLAACVPACTYGFNGDTYEDTCDARRWPPPRLPPTWYQPRASLFTSGRKRRADDRASWVRFDSFPVCAW